MSVYLEAYSVDPDQIDPIEAVWSGSTLYMEGSSNISADDKDILFL